MHSYSQEAVINRAAALVESVQRLQLEPRIVTIGQVFAFRDDLQPVDVWLHAGLRDALAAADLWTDGFVLVFDRDAFDELGVSEDGGLLHAPDVELPFLVWSERPLYSGRVHLCFDLADDTPDPVPGNVPLTPISASESYAVLTASGASAGDPAQAVYSHDTDGSMPLGCWLALLLGGALGLTVLALAVFGAWSLLA